MTGKGKFEKLRNFPCANVHLIFHRVCLGFETVPSYVVGSFVL